MSKQDGAFWRPPGTRLPPGAAQVAKATTQNIPIVFLMNADPVESGVTRDERKKVEMRFAHLKTHHRFERMRLRGLSGARDEFHLAAVVQNLKTLASHLWRPAPNVPAMCVA